MYSDRQFRTAVQKDLDVTWIEERQKGVKVHLSPRSIRARGLERIFKGEPVQLVFEIREVQLISALTGLKGKPRFGIRRVVREPISEDEINSSRILVLRADGSAEVDFPLGPM